jgi:hypothetical protein
MLAKFYISVPNNRKRREKKKHRIYSSAAIPFKKGKTAASYNANRRKHILSLVMEHSNT